MANINLTKAKKAKNDEFYTQYQDIAQEVSSYLEYNPSVFAGKTILCPCDDPFESNFLKYFALHFGDLKLKKLIATCYAGSSIANKELSLFDEESEWHKTTRVPHKIEITEIPDLNNDGAVDLVDVKLLLASDRNHLTRLKGDGDFRSDEITALRDEADVIVTNPPFSLFREFLAWVKPEERQFLVIGSKNALTYKEVFPPIKENKIWVGTTSFNKDMLFISPEELDVNDKPQTALRIINGVAYLRSPSIWFTNIDHGRRHQTFPLMTAADNLKFSRHKDFRGKGAYDKYDNYNAIEVPYTDAIPSDYNGVMGVPISFLDKYCPEQFEIIGATESEGKGFSNGLWDESSRVSQPLINGERVYKRIFIKHKN